SWVTFCAFADEANTKRSVRHSKPRHKVSLRALGCVFVVILIDVRLSRPEAWASGTIAMESAAGAASRPSIRACFLMGVLRDAQLPWGATMCQFSTKERKTGQKFSYEQGPLPASPLWCRVSV